MCGRLVVMRGLAIGKALHAEVVFVAGGTGASDTDLERYISASSREYYTRQQEKHPNRGRMIGEEEHSP
jgi:hypothetical protein